MHKQVVRLKKNEEIEWIRGFVYTLEDEKIIEYMQLIYSQEKLKWLEEINEFTNMVLSDREKELRDKLRACEIYLHTCER